MALAPVGAEPVEVARRDPALIAGDPQMQVDSPRGRCRCSRRRSAKITPSAVRAEWMWTTSPSASRRCRLRSMLMIGVMPLPALMKSSLRGGGSGSTKVPSTPPRRTMFAGPGVAHQIGRDLAGVDQLRRDADAAVGALGLGGERVGAPVVDPVDHDPDPQVLPRPVARPLVAGADQHRDRLRRLPVDPLDPAAQFARRPERVDQFQVVVGEQRG